MKKGFVVVAAIAVLGLAGVAFAQMDQKQGMPPKMGHEQGMMGMMAMHEGMMGKPTLVATSDGGVVVLIGKKLYKYDANLNLVKEAELKVEQSGMMGGGMMMKPGMMGGHDADVSTPGAPAGHEMQH